MKEDSLFLRAFKWLLSSFDNNTPGASGRKLTAFVLMVYVGYLHINFAAAHAVEFLYADLVAIFLLLGIVTVQNIIDFKKKDA
jgi:hypothetical protein